MVDHCEWCLLVFGMMRELRKVQRAFYRTEKDQILALDNIQLLVDHQHELAFAKNHCKGLR